MMGKVVEDFTEPITKTTKGLIVLDQNHPMMQKRNISLPHIIRQAKAACIQCMRCTDMCPRHMLGHRLSPHKIMRGINYLDGDQDVMKMALSCTECGACEYACHMMLLSPQAGERFTKTGAGQKRD
ncbi:MAG: 4Fe-4S dicluster domain-containing protein [Bacillota bacterium]